MGNCPSARNTSRDQVRSQGKVEGEGASADGEWERKRESDAAPEELESRSEEHRFEGTAVVVEDGYDRRPLGRASDQSQLGNVEVEIVGGGKGCLAGRVRVGRERCRTCFGNKCTPISPLCYLLLLQKRSLTSLFLFLAVRSRPSRPNSHRPFQPSSLAQRSLGSPSCSQQQPQLVRIVSTSSFELSTREEGHGRIEVEAEGRLALVSQKRVRRPHWEGTHVSSDVFEDELDVRIRKRSRRSTVSFIG